MAKIFSDCSKITFLKDVRQLSNYKCIVPIISFNEFTFLIAKQDELEEAVESFERALDFAKLQEDREAEKAIKKALKDINERISKRSNDPGEHK